MTGSRPLGRYPRGPRALHRPTTIDEACELLQGSHPDAIPYAGGTDILPALHLGRKVPAALVDLKAIPGLADITLDDRGDLTLGALVTIERLATDAQVREVLPILAPMAEGFASLQVRNRATIGGNLANASPAGDCAPCLLVAEATVRIAGPGGRRRDLPLEQLLTGPGRTALAPGELITAVVIPAQPAGSAPAFIKFCTATAPDIAIVAVAVRLVMDGPVCATARIALGAVAPTPMLAARAAAALQGLPPLEHAPRAGELAAAASSPISDVRATAAYRRHLVGVLTVRAIRQAHARAGQGA